MNILLCGPIKYTDLVKINSLYGIYYMMLIDCVKETIWNLQFCKIKGQRRRGAVLL